MTDVVSLDPPHVRKRDAWFSPVERRMKFFGWPAILGALCLLIGFFSPPKALLRPLWVGGAVLIVPFFFYVYLLPIWHWKDRYRGGNSYLWGAILVIETTGWGKLIYWFRHIIPDWKADGRYFGASSGDR